MEDIKRFEIVDSHKDIAPLFKNLLANSTAMGFEFAAFFGWEDDVIEDLGCPCIAASTPGNYVQRYVDHGYHDVDPFTYVIPASDTTVKYNAVRNMNNEFFNELFAFGLREGMVVPIHVGNRLYSVSFITSRDVKIREDEQSTMEGMAFRFLQDYMRAERRPGANGREEIETRILQMALSGLGNDIIARTLGVTERYVAACRQDAMGKLGTRVPYEVHGPSSKMVGISMGITSVSSRQ
ncbi:MULTISPECIES: autoinducer binding domain-containing protein [unclassified Haematospirillum]|uniref:autoinducer binding domain-containing protein n=1 Tax=unclassified Haematospirillum TaxID=2622088 RepID=UPI00143B0993|nr:MULTISPECIES: autoinducer binding domain-containing protein [unclassified Haematospirillum]NKD54673.1 hypothetical protein [Haematospirillum sp. H4890]NKD74715.1 hypothetical protein [Haematospirillum sp. H4485]